MSVQRTAGALLQRMIIQIQKIVMNMILVPVHQKDPHTRDFHRPLPDPAEKRIAVSAHIQKRHVSDQPLQRLHVIDTVAKMHRNIESRTLQQDPLIDGRISVCVGDHQYAYRIRLFRLQTRWDPDLRISFIHPAAPH